MKRARSVLLVVVAVLVGSLAGQRTLLVGNEGSDAYFVEDEPATAPVRPIAAPEAQRAALGERTLPTPSAPNRRSVALSRNSPLPPLDEPFARHIDELRRRARDGDARAACRLGLQLSYCQRLPSNRWLSARVLADEARPHKRKSGAWIVESTALMEAQCRDVDPLDPLEAFRAQLAASRAGIVQAQLALAAFPPLDGLDVLENVQVWREWRTAARSGLESALASGDPRAAWALANAYDANFVSPWTPRVASPDPYRAYAYRRLVTLLSQRSGIARPEDDAHEEERPGSALTDAQRASAAADAERLLAQHFAGFAPGTAIRGTNGNDFADCEK